MRPRSCMFIVSVVCLIFGQARAADTTQSDAEALLERARKLSDIRRPNSPPFRLKATFSFIGDQLETFEGTYTEFWASDSQWRREIVIKDLKRIEVGTPNRLWLLESGKSLPQHGTRISSAVGMFPTKFAKFEYEAVANRTPDDPSTKCAVTKAAGAHKVKFAFCFDEKTGALLENVAPEFIHERIADYSCVYGRFQKFGDQWVPYDIECEVNRHRQLEVHVEEIVSQSFTDPALFSPPEGAIELGRCLEKGTRPTAEWMPEPMFPAGQREISTWVTLRLIVDTKGNPQNIQVSRSGGKAFDEMAIGSVKKWQFKPGTCDGKPVAVQIEAEVPFRSR